MFLIESFHLFWQIIRENIYGYGIMGIMGKLKRPKNVGDQKYPVIHVCKSEKMRDAYQNAI